MKRLVLLGGGHAHVHVLRALALEPLAGTEVVLVTPFLRQMYSGMVPGLVAGHYTAEQCAIPLAPLARAAGVRLIEGAAVGLDAAVRRVPLADFEASLRALPVPARLLGINNRNLRTFEVSLQATLDLKAMVPADRVLVTESGILAPADVQLMRDAGVHAFLVGEAFMRQPDPGVALSDLFAA